MQYLLTESEMTALVSKKQVEDRDNALEMLRRLVVSDKKCEERRQNEYCDECPLCSANARNNRVGFDVARLLCNRNQVLSK